MTKKILALALAGTTAFSVFASAMSVNATAADNIDAYKSTVPNTEHGAYSPATFTMTTADGNTYTEIVIGGTTLGTSSSLTDFKTAVGNLDTTNYSNIADIDEDGIKSSVVYIFDYVLTSTSTSSKRTALNDVIEEIEGLTGFSGTNYADAATTLTTLGKAIAGLVYDSDLSDGFTATAVSGAGEGNNFRQKVTNAIHGKDLESASNYTDATGANGYNYDTLVIDIEAADDLTGYTGKKTSELIYLLNEYDRLIGLMNPADSDSIEDKIERYIAVLDARSTTDYKKESAYDTFSGQYKKAGEDNEDADTVAELTDYADDLWGVIIADTGESAGADKDALKAMIEDAKTFQTENAYKKADSADKTAFVALLGEAETISGRRSSRSYQSTIDAYTDLLAEAMDAISPTSSVSDWASLRLEEAINNAEALVESDYTTASWKKLQTALTNAQRIMDSRTPTQTTVTNAAKNLEDAIEALRVKPVSASDRKALKDAIDAAKDALDSLDSTASGYQATALTKAISDADDLWSTKYTTLDSDTTISNVSDAIAALEAAMTSAAQPQGWYTDAAGKYMYGEGDGYYVDGWKKIGNFWFFFNEDGTAKQNEWFQDGGKWYYAGNSCVAYSGWGKVDGSWYYFGKDCAMATGWVRPANSYYYLDPTSGKMVTGWAQIGGKWYYFSTDANTLGAMLVSTTTPDGYQVGADGAMI